MTDSQARNTVDTELLDAAPREFPDSGGEPGSAGPAFAGVSDGATPLDPYPYVPAELKALRRWVVWRLEERDGKPTKVLYNPISRQRADTTKEETWVDYSVAVAHAPKYNGLGCVIASPYVGIDLDKCRNRETGEIELWARKIITELNSYTELSPSGTGCHIWVRGGLPEGGRRRAGRAEMYDRDRYFTVTGKALDWVSPIVEARDLALLHARLTELDPEYVAAQRQKEHHRAEARGAPKAAGAKAGSKFDLLMAGSWKDAGYGSQSEADQALCVMLAMRHHCDPTKIDQEFRRSGLYRQKWERNDYRDRTIRRAIELAKQNPGTGHSEKLIVQCFSEIETKPIEWVWQDRIPKAKLTVFSGNPDVGKTLVACDVIARYTTGRDWGDGSPNTAPPGEVYVLLAEDDAGDTIKPRLQAAGANMRRVHEVKGVVIEGGPGRRERALALDTDLELIRQAVSDNPRIGLVVIDPVTSFLGKSDLNKEQEVRRVLCPLKEFCEETGVTIIALGHFNKRSDVGALHKVGGAVAMSGVPRAVWLFANDPEREGDYVMLLGKGNLTKKRTGLRYCFSEKQLPTGAVPVIQWKGKAAESNADEVFSTAADPKEKRRARAERFLREYLAERPRPSEQILVAGNDQNISRNALYEAKKALRVLVLKHRDCWWWALRGSEEQTTGERNESKLWEPSVVGRQSDQGYQAYQS